MAGLAEVEWLAPIGECFIKSSGALLIAILLAILLRRQSAGLRHFVLSFFLISLIFFPLLSSFPSGWETRLLPSWLDAQGYSRVKVEPLAPGSHSWLRDPAGLWPAFPDGRAMNSPSETASEKGPGIPGYGKILAAGVLLVWLSGLMILLSRIALGILGASRLSREGERLDDSAWQILVQRFLSAVALRRNIDLKSHKKISIPLTWGLWKPVVIMPAGAADWDEEKRSSALFHELAHVKRADFLVTMLVRLSLAFFWLNPLTWVVFKMMKKEQEKACDALALRAGIKPSTYAASLLSIQRSSTLSGYSSAVVLGMAGRSLLNDRLVTILRQKLAFKEVKMKTKIMISVLAFLAVSFIGLARPSSSPDYHDVALSPLAPADFGIDNPPQGPAAQEDQEKKQPEPAEKKAEPADKDTDKDKDKDKEKKPIVISVKEGIESKEPITITITEGDRIKTIKVDGPIILRKDGAGKKILVTSKGKEIVISEGPDVFLEIKGDRVSVHEHSVSIEPDQGVMFRVEDKDKGSKIILAEKPYIVIRKGKEGERRFLVVRPDLENLEEKIGEIEESLKSIDEHQPDVEAALKKADQVIKEVLDKELKQKLEKLHEQLSLNLETKIAVREEVLEEVRKSLEELRLELEEKADKLKEVEVAVKVPEIHLTIEHPDEPLDIERDWAVVEKDLENGILVTVKNDKEGKHYLIWKSRLGENRKEAYEKAVEKLKKGLPEGYELQSEFKEKTGAIVIKITVPDSKAESQDVLKKLINELKEELKSKEPGSL